MAGLKTQFQPATPMPIVDADELNNRHREFIREISDAIHKNTGPARETAALKARQSYADWFERLGIRLSFNDGYSRTNGERG